MSRIGVPSITSTPRKCTKPPFGSTESIATSVRPIGFGRCGVRVANTPEAFPSSIGGCIFACCWRPRAASWNFTPANGRQNTEAKGQQSTRKEREKPCDRAARQAGRGQIARCDSSAWTAACPVCHVLYTLFSAAAQLVYTSSAPVARWYSHGSRRATRRGSNPRGP